MTNFRSGLVPNDLERVLFLVNGGFGCQETFELNPILMDGFCCATVLGNSLIRAWIFRIAGDEFGVRSPASATS